MKYSIRLFTTIGLFIWTNIACSQSNFLDIEIDLKLENVSIKAALQKIEQQAHVDIAFGNSKEMEKNITASYSNKTVRDILDNVLHKNGLDYKVVGGNVTVFVSKEKLKETSDTYIEKPDYSVSGHVYDKETGEVLIGATIYEPVLHKGTSTNNFGFFSLKLPGGKHELIISFLGFEEQKVVVDRAQILSISLPLAKTTLKEVIVTVDKNEEVIQSAALGKIELTVAEINSIPAVGGESDVLKTITLLPGIKSGVDASSGFYVRGGGPDQNLILLDGVPLYNPYHLWGFLSTFNSDAINNLEITKGAFPARYGGRLSSILDITLREGNSLKWEKDLTIGLLSTKALVSGPVVKDKSSIMIGARRTYADLIVAPILNASYSGNGFRTRTGYSFTDLNLKFNYKLSERDRLFVSGFYSRDILFLSEKFTESTSNETIENTSLISQGWGNGTASFRWNHLFSNKLFVNSTAYFSDYRYFTNTESRVLINSDKEENSMDYTSRISDFAIKQDYEYYPNNRHTFRFGAGFIQHRFEPGINSIFIETGENRVENRVGEIIESNELDIYVEDDFDLHSRLKLNIGLHGSAFFVDNTNYLSLQPRISSRFSLNDRASLKASVSTMAQYLHLLTGSGVLQSSDLWVPSTSKIKPKESIQYSVGTAINLDGNYLLEVDGYYSKMKNLIEFRNGSNLSRTSNWENEVESGNGDSYGIEMFLKKHSGRLTGWVGYTLSWSNRKFANINFGQTFPYRYDRRHDISLVGFYTLSDKWSLNGAWVFNTGNAITLPTQAYVNPNYSGETEFGSNGIFDGPSFIQFWNHGVIENSFERNNFRLPSYHRLDVGAARKVERKRTFRELRFGLTNLYNRKNPSFFYVLEDVDGNIKYIAQTLFPLLPTISYKISFR